MRGARMRHGKFVCSKDGCTVATDKRDNVARDACTSRRGFRGRVTERVLSALCSCPLKRNVATSHALLHIAENLSTHAHTHLVSMRRCHRACATF